MRPQIAQAHQGIDQGIHLGSRDFAGAVEEVVFAKKVIGFLHVFCLKSADRNKNPNCFGTIPVVVEVINALVMSRQHASYHGLIAGSPGTNYDCS